MRSFSGVPSAPFLLLRSRAGRIALLLALAAALTAAEPAPRSFNLPAGEAMETLKLFATQAEREILFPASSVAGVPTPPVQGSFAPREALARLTAGTELGFVEDPATGAFVVTRPPVAAAVSAPASIAAGMSAPPAVAAPRARPFALLAGWLGAALAPVSAADAPRPSATAAASGAGETVLLSPFEVSTTADVGYLARATLGGTRLNTSLRDVASQVSVMTPEFLEDIAATTLEDAYRYSINVENLSEWQSSSTNNGDFNSGTINNATSRTRGLSKSTESHDFFTTAFPLDTYNSERFTLTSGPNAILFGLGSPAGLTDTTFKRARPDRAFGSLGLRTDSEKSLRTTADFNLPLRPGVAALRVALLDDDANQFRRPAGERTKRHFGTLTVKPFAHTQVRAWFEDIAIDRIPMRNTLVRDLVTPWVNAGRPLFNNFGLTTQAQVTNRIAANGQTAIFQRRANNGAQYALGQIAGAPFIGFWANTVETRGPDALLPVPDTNLIQTLRDPTVFPWKVTVNGNGTRLWQDGWIAGAAIEQQLFRSLHLEFAYNREKNTLAFHDFARGSPAVQADANLYLADGVTPNPNAGRYFFTHTQARANYSFGEREGVRLLASYDFTPSRWERWLGRHRVAGLLSRDTTLNADAQGRHLTIINNTPLTTGTPETQLRNANRALQIRAYVDDPRAPGNGGIHWVNLPWDAFANTTLPDGTQVATIRNPYGALNPGEIDRDKVSTAMGILQSTWLDGRLVTTLGWRHDNVKEVGAVTPLLGPGNAPYMTNTAYAQQLPGYDTFDSGNTRTLGLVAHPLRWLSLHYSRSNSFSPGSLGHNPDGSLIPGAHGEGKDYGFSLAPFGDRVFLRVNFYDQTSGPVGGGTFNSVIRGTVDEIEEAVLAQGAPRHPHYDPYLEGYYELSASTRSKGTEFELVGNPTPQWRLSVGGAKAKAIQWDIGRPWAAFVRERSAVWGRYADAPTITGTGNVRGRFLNMVDELNQMEQVDGSAVDSGRSWRFNATTRYTFREAWFRGAFVGGVYQWRSKSVIGYEYRNVRNTFPFPGLGDTIPASDVSRPVFGRAITTVDAFLGYGRRILRDRVNLRVQLNIRNLFEDDGIIAQSSYSDGSVRFFTIPQPRKFILTTTFGF